MATAAMLAKALFVAMIVTSAMLSGAEGAPAPKPKPKPKPKPVPKPPAVKWTPYGPLVGAKGKFSNTGDHVAVSGNGLRVAITAPNYNAVSPQLFIFSLVKAKWVQEGPALLFKGTPTETFFEITLALDFNGNTLAVGTPSAFKFVGEVLVYTRSAKGKWARKAALTAKDAKPNNGFGVALGISVSINRAGTRIAAGGSYDNGEAGAVWLFGLAKGKWVQEGKKLVDPKGANQRWFGRFIGLDGAGQTLVISGSGPMFIFARSAKGAWALKKREGFYLPYPPMDGLYFEPVAISADGKTVATGVRDSTKGGAVAVWKIRGGKWVKVVNKIRGIGLSAAAGMGYGVSLSANGAILAAGAPYDAIGACAQFVTCAHGAVAIFVLGKNGKYTQQGAKLVVGSKDSVNSMQGYSVALSAAGARVVVGAPGWGANSRGTAFVYTRK